MCQPHSLKIRDLVKFPWHRSGKPCRTVVCSALRNNTWINQQPAHPWASRVHTGTPESHYFHYPALNISAIKSRVQVLRLMKPALDLDKNKNKIRKWCGVRRRGNVFVFPLIWWFHVIYIKFSSIKLCATYLIRSLHNTRLDPLPSLRMNYSLN